MYTRVAVLYSITLLSCFKQNGGLSSPLCPYQTYQYSAELQSNVADLWWTVDRTKKEIMFELHMKMNGWIALGVSPGNRLKKGECIELGEEGWYASWSNLAGGMEGADIGLGWVDRSGQLFFEVSSLPSTTTEKWITNK